MHRLMGKLTDAFSVLALWPKDARGCYSTYIFNQNFLQGALNFEFQFKEHQIFEESKGFTVIVLHWPAHLKSSTLNKVINR